MSGNGNTIGFGDKASCTVRRRPETESTLKISGYCKVVCKDADGNVKWVDEGHNVVTDEGINWILDNDIAAATLYVGLTDGTPSVAAADTLSTHGGWTEVTAYSSPANRGTWGHTLSGTALSNSAAVTFTMNGSTTVGGAFIATVNTGTGGTLVAVKEFTTGDKSVQSSDTLDVTYTITGDSSP